MAALLSGSVLCIYEFHACSVHVDCRFMHYVIRNMIFPEVYCQAFASNLPLTNTKSFLPVCLLASSVLWFDNVLINLFIGNMGLIVM